MNATETSGLVDEVKEAVIVEAIQTIVRGRYVELRAIRKGSAPRTKPYIYPVTETGLSDLAKTAARLNSNGFNCYFTLNRLDERPAGGATKDLDVSRRDWLLIDLDPVRPSDVSSTDSEHQAALDLAENIAAQLGGDGFPEPILVDSGNGSHLLYRIDLPADDGGLVSRFLVGLASRFDTESVRIDVAVGNPSRISKIPGTLARKGESTADRPHRMSRIVREPADGAKVVPAGLLEAITSQGAARLGTSSLSAPEPTAAPSNDAILARQLETVDPNKAHGRKALDLECGEVAAAAEGGRNHRLFKSAAKLVELVNAGELDWPTVESRLRDAAKLAGLSDHEINQTLASARRKVGDKARDVSHVGKGRAVEVPTIVDEATGLAEGVDNDYRLARVVLETRYGHPDRPRLAYWKAEWHEWRGGAWRTVPDVEVNAGISAVCRAEFERHASTDGKAVRTVGTRLVGNVAAALRQLVLLAEREYPEQPMWLSGDGPDPAECISFPNGILHLPTLVDRGPEAALIPPTPNYFAANVLDFAFDPEPSPPVAFFAFLDSIWGDDPESVDALQEWFGYLLTPDTSRQKALMIVGPPRSGKGTIARLLANLLGPWNTAAPKLGALGTQFGLQGLIGRSVAFCGETRLTARSDGPAILESVLSISGEDEQQIDRKHATPWMGRLRTRFVFLANELPRFADASKALATRLIFLKLSRSFVGREDADLESKLKAERSAVLLWSIGGWERLRESGRFTQPASAADEVREMESLCDPLGAFLEERCEVGPDLVGDDGKPVAIQARRLYQAWAEWCQENGRGHKAGDTSWFGQKLKASAPFVVRFQKRNGADREPWYRHVRLAA